MQRRSLSVAHVTTSASGGAGRAARRINAALRAAGHGSFVVAGDIHSKAEGIIKLDLDTGALNPAQKTVRKFNGDFLQFKYIERMREKKRTNTLFSAGLDGANILSLPFIQSADVVHLHWTPRLLPPNAIQRLLAAGKSMVWTLHDQWPFTGGCHYSDGCERYRETCSPCPQMRKDPWNLPAILQAEKAAAFSRGLLTVVAPSAWMADCARESAVFRNARIEVVRNPIETDVFRPLAPDQRRDLRARIGVAEEDIVLLAGANTNAEIRKGYDLLVDGLRRFMAGGGAEAIGPGRRLWVFAFGHQAATIEEPGVGFMDFGSVENDATLASILSMGDLILLPSREDNYPNVMIEGMSAGTPVAAFARGGMREIIEDGRTGFLMGEEPSAAGVAAAIGRAVQAGTGALGAMGAAARETLRFTHDMVSVGSAYEAIYKSLLPLRRVMEITVPTIEPQTSSVAELYTKVRVPVETAHGPAFATPAVAEAIGPAIGAYVAAEGEVAKPDDLIAAHAGVAAALPEVQLLTAAAAGQRAGFDVEEARELGIGIPSPSAQAATSKPAGARPSAQAAKPKAATALKPPAAQDTSFLSVSEIIGHEVGGDSYEHVQLNTRAVLAGTPTVLDLKLFVYKGAVGLELRPWSFRPGFDAWPTDAEKDGFGAVLRLFVTKGEETKPWGTLERFAAADRARLVALAAELAGLVGDATVRSPEHAKGKLGVEWKTAAERVAVRLAAIESEKPASDSR